MADDHEEVLNVRILPARPIDAEREYAGREKNNDSSFTFTQLFFTEQVKVT